jgi:hypothetical protein
MRHTSFRKVDRKGPAWSELWMTTEFKNESQHAKSRHGIVRARGTKNIVKSRPT